MLITKTEIEQVCNQVLREITPTKKDREKINAIVQKIMERVSAVSKEYGIFGKVLLAGSVAKETWLRQDPDIDVFMQVPTTISTEAFRKTCLTIAKKAVEDYPQIERFADHPYLEAIVDNTRVNIVPCFKVQAGNWISATDRTPFHTKYVNEKITDSQRNEVLLLKKFLKGIKVYGAEIRIGGFSGYLCELLVLHYKSFLNILNTFAKYQEKIIVDLEKLYAQKESLETLFKQPIIIIDPVDKKRNVASAVRLQNLYTTIAASRAFLRNPRTSFFKPKKIVPLPPDQLKQEMITQKSPIIFLTFKKSNPIPDVLWGQLYKSQRALRKLLEMNDFTVLRSTVWSNEKNLNIQIFELEQQFLPKVKKRCGPPLEKEEECEKFLKKHLTNPQTVAGPYIENGKWTVEIHRKRVNGANLLKEGVTGKKKIGLSRQIAQTIAHEYELYINENIMELYKKNREFAKFLTSFLSGKPEWLSPT